MDCVYVLHDATYSQRILNYYYYFFFISLAYSVEWHVPKGNKAGHLKLVVTVRRKACRRLQIESEHLVFSLLA